MSLVLGGEGVVSATSLLGATAMSTLHGARVFAVSRCDVHDHAHELRAVDPAVRRTMSHAPCGTMFGGTVHLSTGTTKCG